MKNKTLANWLTGTMAFIVWVSVTSADSELIALAGIAIWVFVIMAIIRLRKLND